MSVLGYIGVDFSVVYVFERRRVFFKCQVSFIFERLAKVELFIWGDDVECHVFGDIGARVPCFDDGHVLKGRYDRSRVVRRHCRL